MKVLMAPVSIAGQPIAAVKELRRLGVDASLLQYGRHAFGYEAGEVVDLAGRDRTEAVTEVLKRTLEQGYDIYHFWMCSLFAGGLNYPPVYGLDLPFLKARGKRLVFRATGWDVRLISDHKARNPHNPFAYGYELGLDEGLQRHYLDLLRSYVDQLIVQDPELHEFVPEARVVPRGIDLDAWPVVGVQPSDRPLVVHAPSKTKVKGTEILEQALRELKQEGLRFDFKLVTGMAHAEAAAWYRRADIVVDQLHIGWYGVLAMEAMALGKPVVGYVRPDLLERFDPAIPIANANPETVKAVLRELIESYEARRALAEQARPFAEEVHDIRRVARQLRAIYVEVLDRPPRPPAGLADLDWFVRQCERLEAPAERLEIRRKAHAYDLLPEMRRKARDYDALAAEAQGLRRQAEARGAGAGANGRPATPGWRRRGRQAIRVLARQLPDDVRVDLYRRLRRLERSPRVVAARARGARAVGAVRELGRLR